MAVAEEADERALRVERVAAGPEAAELHVRRAVGRRNGRRQALLRVGGLHPDGKAEADVEDRPPRGHGRPVAGMKSADVEEIRLLEPGDLGLGLRVELRFEPVQRLDDRIRRLDRIRSAVRVRRVPRVGLQGDARPDDANRDKVHASVRRLGDQRGVGRGARQDRSERAVPPALLFDHALVDEPAGERARRERRLDAQEHRRDPAFHIAGAAAVHASIGYLAAERLLRPAVESARR